ncbi:double-strand break repair protein AddB [Salipiger sp. IMCC34102]|uniref:double-strand break repair protein AddB n=1 Tax=Salipiger sp. IMCC34102 TaxID=2510647 RepID=UPI00101E0022|nr:double-strand break repair protein AddB [Salipiger sp. IMCC34102]RYH04232.1 double-strand break repair protein AddB [Salipiger sp. IMCC34102]
MFDPAPGPRVFGLAPGVPFARAFVDGLLARSEDLSRVRVYVNSARMQRQMRAAFDDGPARLLPRVRLVTDLAFEGRLDHLTVPVSPLRRRLELSRAVERLIEAVPGLPRAALYDLSDSLAALMDEMHGEGVNFETIATLDISDVSGHWQTALDFLRLLEPYFIADAEQPDTDALQRMQVLALTELWAENPPEHPVIVAGSTGSRGATGLFMQAVARLPQGALVLPGFDFDMPGPVWDSLDATGSRPDQEDHPQFRYRRLLRELDLPEDRVRPWTDAPAPAPARNRLVSLSLRPAPVTDQWRREGAALGDLVAATDGMTLVEAPSPRAEAEAIALGLRQAAAAGKVAALITPDRMLTRQVAAALDRWDIRADDSAGLPLELSAPGRLLNQLAQTFGTPVTAQTLLVLLKHPLANTGGTDRGDHLRRTRDLELALRRAAVADLTAEALSKHGGDDPHWTAWITRLLAALHHGGTRPIAEHHDHLVRTACDLAAGPDATGSGDLFDKDAGRKARGVCQTLARDADAGNPMSPRDYAALLGALLAQGTVRDRDAGRTDVLILGTLEARVGGPDVVILGGLNDGIWPPAPKPDPWLNRTLRARAGLLLPERQVGLSAHDYQQAIGAKEVWITRALRDSDAQTVPSRWVNRLTNLLGGLKETRGTEALGAMRARGAVWLQQAQGLSVPTHEVPKARRPAPNPPPQARPDRISVTQIKTLYRDPFAIYAQGVLRLRALDPLVPDAGPAMKGTLYHEVLERFLNTRPDVTAPGAEEAFLALADEVLAEHIPWPAVRLRWRTELAQLAAPFLAQEAQRQARGTVVATEALAEIAVPPAGIKLRGYADRIDEMPDGRVVIFDYKTGAVPTAKEQARFDKQLLAEAAMMERGAFANLGQRPVAGAEFLAFKRDMKSVAAPLDTHPTARVWAELQDFLTRWMTTPEPMIARRAPKFMGDYNDYDHLSRRGEWSDSDRAEPEDLT